MSDYTPPRDVDGSELPTPGVNLPPDEPTTPRSDVGGPVTEAGRVLTEHYSNFPVVVKLALAIQAEASRSVLSSERFIDAVDSVFAAPGEFGPAKAYYGDDTMHFVKMLQAEYERTER